MPRTTLITEAKREAVAPPPAPERLDDSEYGKLSIWQAMEKMTPDDWSDKILYIYRIQPLSYKKSSGQHEYIQKRLTPIDKNELQATFGGGVFQLLLNSVSSGKNLIKGQVSLPGKPILLEDEELKTRPQKDSVEPAPSTVVQGTSVDDTIKLMTAMKDVASRTPQDPTPTALNKALELVAEGAKQGMQITSQQASSSAISVDKLLELALKSREPKEDPMMKNLIEPVLQRALNPPPPPKEKSLKEWLDEMDALEERFGSRRGSSRGPGGLWEVIGQAVSRLADAAPELIRALRDSRGAGPVVRIPNPSGASVPSLPATIMTPSVQPPHVASAAIPQPPALDPQIIIKSRIVRAFVDGDDGEFIGWYLQKEAPAIYAALKGKTIDELKGFLSTDMILKEMLGKEGIDEFLAQILAYINEDEVPVPSETVQ